MQSICNSAILALSSENEMFSISGGQTLMVRAVELDEVPPRSRTVALTLKACPATVAKCLSTNERAWEPRHVGCNSSEAAVSQPRARKATMYHAASQQAVGLKRNLARREI